MRPDAIHKSWGKVRIVFLTKPGHQRHARIGMRQRIDRRAAEQLADLQQILGVLSPLLIRSGNENFWPRHFSPWRANFQYVCRRVAAVRNVSASNSPLIAS